MTGFTDAEGCFQLVIYKNPKMRSGWSVRLVFSIHLHVKEIDVLYKIQKFFGGIGTVGTESNRAFFSVEKIEDILEVIIPHFISYPLITQKRKDFILWSRIAEMIGRKEHLTIEGMDLLKSIKSGMNTGRK